MIVYKKILRWLWLKLTRKMWLMGFSSFAMKNVIDNKGREPS